MKKSPVVEVRIMDFGIVFKDSEKTAMFAYSDKYSIDSYMEAADSKKKIYDALVMDPCYFANILDSKSISNIKTYMNKFNNVLKLKSPEFIQDTIDMLRESQRKTICLYE